LFQQSLGQWRRENSGAVRTPPTRGSGRNAGFALIIVLWTLVLLAFLVGNLTASGRAEIKIASNLAANAVATAAADGGISTAIFKLLETETDRGWAIGGSAHEFQIGASRVVVTVEDEAARINPNWASPALLEALIRTVGHNFGNARQLATSISEWVGTAPVLDLSNATTVGEDRYRPRGKPLERLDELARLPGMTPELFRALRPHLTLFGLPMPSPTTEDPIVAAALAQLTLSQQASVAANQMPPDIRTARIASVATGPRNARVSRTAVIRFGPMLPGGYGILAWGSLD
jgi:general secretion pathway protein K